MLGDKISTTPPEGYDPKLWASIPSVRAQLYPGKHDIYTFGQSSADGVACIGCQWQDHRLLSGSVAVGAHDSYHNRQHDCSVWVHKKGVCPCGKEAEEHKRDQIKAEALEEFYTKIHGQYALNFGSVDELYEHISFLLKRDAEELRK